jgi:tRNA U54 and U55 pseudouridine synthase Pus10
MEILKVTQSTPTESQHRYAEQVRRQEVKEAGKNNERKEK